MDGYIEENNNLSDISQFFLGSYLGDGSFVKKSSNHNTYAVFKHCDSQYEYLCWKYKFLQDHGYIKDTSAGIVKVNIKKGSCYDNFQGQHMFATLSSEKLNKYKELTENEIIDEFGELAFVIWLLDDGNICKRCIKISCGLKQETLISRLTEKMNSMFGIDASLYNHPTNPAKNYIRIPARDFSMVESVVLKYIPDDIDVVIEKFVKNRIKRMKIKYHAEISTIGFVDGKSDWVDLRAAERVEMKQGDYKVIPLGISCSIEDGYEAHIVPRSSTFKTWGILQTNGCGIIDSSYCGNNDIWGFPALAMRDTVIEKNDRICQFRLVEKMGDIEFIATDDLGGKSRGGFGSTGAR